MKIRELRVLTDSQAPLSPFLFGHNLEHTRACMSGGLSAQVLRNRKFAGRPGARTGVAAEWKGIGERAYFCNDQDAYVCHMTENGMRRRNETNAQTVQNPTEGREAGIEQSGLELCGTAYDFAVVARSSVPVCLHVRLWAREKLLEEKTVHLHEDSFQRCEVALTVPQRAEAILSITFTERARVVFGSVSMLPRRHFYGMRWDVVREMQKIGITLLRWPGGNFAGEYRWQDMFLPVDQRAPLQAVTEDETQPYTHGYDVNDLDTDDYIMLCRKIGAEPFITVNLAWDTPEQCAAWVEYCNGGTDTVYGRKRAERGHEEPYNVRFWSLGNEMGYGHMEGPMDPEKYAALGKEAARAMRSVSPDIQIVSCGPYHDGARARTWVNASAAALYPEAQYISYHVYQGSRQDFTTPERVRKTYTDMVDSVRGNLEALRELRAVTPEGIHISCDEWNVWAAWFRKPNAMEGIYTACMLHMLLRHAAELDMPLACYFQPVGEGAIDVFPDHACLTPNGRVFNMIMAHRGGTYVPVLGGDAVASMKWGLVTMTLLNTDYDEDVEYVMPCLGKVFPEKLLVASDLLPGSVFEEREVSYTAGDRVHVFLPPRSVGRIRFKLTDY